MRNSGQRYADATAAYHRNLLAVEDDTGITFAGAMGLYIERLRDIIEEGLDDGNGIRTHHGLDDTGRGHIGPRGEWA